MSMSRPMALVLVLLVLFLTSQSEWRASNLQSTPLLRSPGASTETAFMSKQHRLEMHQDSIKEKIILDLMADVKHLEAQNRNLADHVRTLNQQQEDLRQKLAMCSGKDRHSISSVPLDRTSVQVDGLRPRHDFSEQVPVLEGSQGLHRDALAGDTRPIGGISRESFSISASPREMLQSGDAEAEGGAQRDAVPGVGLLGRSLDNSLVASESDGKQQTSSQSPKFTSSLDSSALSQRWTASRKGPAADSLKGSPRLGISQGSDSVRQLAHAQLYHSLRSSDPTGIKSGHHDAVNAADAYSKETSVERPLGWQEGTKRESSNEVTAGKQVNSMRHALVRHRKTLQGTIFYPVQGKGPRTPWSSQA